MRNYLLTYNRFWHERPSKSEKEIDIMNTKKEAKDVFLAAGEGVVKCMDSVLKAYGKYYTDKAEAAEAAKIALEKRQILDSYVTFTPEIAEIVRAAARVLPTLRSPQPIDLINLPFDFKNADYKIMKMTADGEEITARRIKATLNAIAADRHRHGLSTFEKPFVFEVFDKGKHIIIRANGDNSKPDDITPIAYKDVGAYVGLLGCDYDYSILNEDGSPAVGYYIYVQTTRHFLSKGKKFQILDNSVWRDTSLEWSQADGFYFCGYRDVDLHGKFARIVK